MSGSAKLWKFRQLPEQKVEERPYPLRIGLLFSNPAKYLFTAFIKKHEKQLDHFFKFTNAHDKFTCIGTYGGSIVEEKIQPISRYWRTSKISYIDHYKINVIPILYPFLYSLDSQEYYNQDIRYLFIEIGTTFNSVLVKGEYFDNPLNFGLRTTIWCHEQSPI